MTGHEIRLEPLTREAFAQYGDVLEASGTPDMEINAGRCFRFHDLARLDFLAEDGRAGISILRSEACVLPYSLNLMERHPLGSQAFAPMTADPFLVIVAQDNGGRPGMPRAFLSQTLQGVNYLCNTWHGVLAPLTDDATFIVIDRIGVEENLEEFFFDTPYLIVE